MDFILGVALGTALSPLWHYLYAKFIAPHVHNLFKD